MTYCDILLAVQMWPKAIRLMRTLMSSVLFNVNSRALWTASSKNSQLLSFICFWMQFSLTKILFLHGQAPWSWFKKKKKKLSYTYAGFYKERFAIKNQGYSQNPRARNSAHTLSRTVWNPMGSHIFDFSHLSPLSCSVVVVVVVV